MFSGDFASAIETLVTAISLIKQSKIASDDRCKILISSLQDTLHGIEEKSYGARYCVFSPLFFFFLFDPFTSVKKKSCGRTMIGVQLAIEAEFLALEFSWC